MISLETAIFHMSQKAAHKPGSIAHEVPIALSAPFPETVEPACTESSVCAAWSSELLAFDQETQTCSTHGRSRCCDPTVDPSGGQHLESYKLSLLQGDGFHNMSLDRRSGSMTLPHLLLIGRHLFKVELDSHTGWCCRKNASRHVHELTFSVPRRTRLHTQGYACPWLHKVKVARAAASR